MKNVVNRFVANVVILLFYVLYIYIKYIGEYQNYVFEQARRKRSHFGLYIFMMMFCNGSFIAVYSTIELIECKQKLNEKELNVKYKLKKIGRAHV